MKHYTTTGSPGELPFEVTFPHMVHGTPTGTVTARRADVRKFVREQWPQVEAWDFRRDSGGLTAVAVKLTLVEGPTTRELQDFWGDVRQRCAENGMPAGLLDVVPNGTTALFDIGEGGVCIFAYEHGLLTSPGTSIWWDDVYEIARESTPPLSISYHDPDRLTKIMRHLVTSYPLIRQNAKMDAQLKTAKEQCREQVDELKERLIEHNPHGVQLFPESDGIRFMADKLTARHVLDILQLLDSTPKRKYEAPPLRPRLSVINPVTLSTESKPLGLKESLEAASHELGFYFHKDLSGLIHGGDEEDREFTVGQYLAVVSREGTVYRLISNAGSRRIKQEREDIQYHNLVQQMVDVIR